MHDNSLQQMSLMLDKLDPNQNLSVLDVGSMDVNGTYRPLINLRPNWQYTGIDLAAGPNVDLVAVDPYDFGSIGEYDVIISGNCMEHVPMPWLWILNVYRLLKPGGVFINVTPFSIGYHPYPVDCWRILPDGSSALYGEWLVRNGLKPFQVLANYQSSGYLTDVVFAGRKPVDPEKLSVNPLLN